MPFRLRAALFIFSGLFSFCAVAEEASKFVPDTNFRDLAIDGYCLGVSGVNAVRSAAPSLVKQFFGERIADLVRKEPNDILARRELLRVFALLQFSRRDDDPIVGIPLDFDWRARQSNPAEKYYRNMDKLHEAIQAQKAKGSGVFLEIHYPTFPISAGHSLYAIDSSFDGKKYNFVYRDPNYPAGNLTFQYDPDKDKIITSDDPTLKRIQSFYFNRAFTRDEEFKRYKMILDRIAHSDRPIDLMLAGYLSVPGAPKDWVDVFDRKSKNFEHRFTIFKNLMDELIEKSRKLVAEIPQGNINNLPEDKRKKAQSEIEMSVGAILEFARLAGQSFLETDCQLFSDFTKKFTGLVQSKLKDPFPPFKGKDFELKGSPIGFAGAMFHQTLFGFGMNELLKEYSDGIHLGEFPSYLHKEIACVNHTVIPALAVDEDSPIRHNSRENQLLPPENLTAWLSMVHGVKFDADKPDPVSASLIRSIPAERSLSTGLLLMMSPKAEVRKKGEPYLRSVFSTWKDVFAGSTRSKFFEDDNLWNSLATLKSRLLNRPMRQAIVEIEVPKLSPEAMPIIERGLQDILNHFENSGKNVPAYFEGKKVDFRGEDDLQFPPSDKTLGPADYIRQEFSQFFPRLKKENTKPHGTSPDHG